MAAKKHKGLSVHLFKTPARMEAWLERNGKPGGESIWLKIAKKQSGKQSVNYEQARETAIRYGWIDGLINKYDDAYYLIKFSPRRPRSAWSKINRGIAEQLIRDGRMQPWGYEQVEAAKADGRWQAAYDSPRTIEVPSDLAVLLKKSPKAAAHFEGLNSSNRYAFLIRLQTAKTKATREKRLRETVAKLSRGESYHSAAESKSASPSTAKKPPKEHTPTKKTAGKKTAGTAAFATQSAKKPSAKGIRYVLLLRGVNVGGHRPVKMSELKVALEKAGLRDVQTYIQSGNIVCAATLAVPEVQQLVREVIHRKWGYEVEVQAYTLAAWRRILAQCPYSEQSKKLNFVFLEKAPAKRKLETIVQGMLKPSEKAAVYGRVVYLLCPEGLGKSKFNLDTLASQLGVQATCRNWNTVERLGVMLESPSG